MLYVSCSIFYLDWVGFFDVKQPTTPVKRWTKPQQTPWPYVNSSDRSLRMHLLKTTDRSIFEKYPGHSGSFMNDLINILLYLQYEESAHDDKVDDWRSQQDIGF